MTHSFGKLINCFPLMLTLGIFFVLLWNVFIFAHLGVLTSLANTDTGGRRGGRMGKGRAEGEKAEV